MIEYRINWAIDVLYNKRFFYVHPMIMYVGMISYIIYKILNLCMVCDVILWTE